MQGGMEGSDRSTVTLPASNRDVHLLLKGKPLRHSAHRARGWLAKMYLTLLVDRFSRRNLAQEKALFISRCCYRKRNRKALQPQPSLLKSLKQLTESFTHSHLVGQQQFRENLNLGQVKGPCTEAPMGNQNQALT